MTILGIIIAIMSIVALITISSSLKNSIEEQFSKIGATRLYVFPKTNAGFVPTQGLEKKDGETLERLSEFKWVTPYLMQSSSVEFNNEVKKKNRFYKVKEVLQKIVEDEKLLSEGEKSIKKSPLKAEVFWRPGQP